MLLKKQKQTPLPMHNPEMRGREGCVLSRAKEKQAAVHSILYLWQSSVSCNMGKLK